MSKSCDEMATKCPCKENMQVQQIKMGSLFNFPVNFLNSRESSS